MSKNKIKMYDTITCIVQYQLYLILQQLFTVFVYYIVSSLVSFPLHK